MARIQLIEGLDAVPSLAEVIGPVGHEVARRSRSGEPFRAAEDVDALVWDLSSDPSASLRELDHLLSSEGTADRTIVAVLPADRPLLQWRLRRAGCRRLLERPVSASELARELSDSPETFDDEDATCATILIHGVGDALGGELQRELRAEGYAAFWGATTARLREIASRFRIDVAVLLEETGETHEVLTILASASPDASLVIVDAAQPLAGEKSGGLIRRLPRGATVGEIATVVADAVRVRRGLASRAEEKRLLVAKDLELHGLNESLRTLNRAVVVANRRLEQQGQMKSELIGIVAHELKSPLAAMAGALEILCRENETADEVESRLLGLVQRNNQRMIKLVNDILELSRLESGRVRLKPTPTIPDRLVEQSISVVAHKAAGKGVLFDVESDVFPERVLLDGDRVAQMLINLTDNAVKFSPAGGIVRIQVKRREGRIHFVVSDEGPGIPPGEWEWVFESFHHRARGDDPHSAGSGLGLTITKALAEYHEGSITVGTSPSGGGQFTLTLPLRPAPRDD